MITAITIQNFKGIGNEPFRLPIKPLTVLFGPNSAGKSTILGVFVVRCAFSKMRSAERRHKSSDLNIETTRRRSVDAPGTGPINHRAEDHCQADVHQERNHEYQRQIRQMCGKRIRYAVNRDDSRIFQAINKCVISPVAAAKPALPTERYECDRIHHDWNGSED
jgi:predicted ATP-binding protein involved in virulence